MDNDKQEQGTEDSDSDPAHNSSPEPPAGLQFNAIIPSNFGNEYEVAYPCTSDDRPNHVNKILPSHTKHKAKTYVKRSTLGHGYLLERKLREAVNNSDWGSLCKLIDGGVDPSGADSKGRTALHFAATHGDEHIVKTLIDHRANVNARDLNGNTPLHLAACSNQVKIVTLLLRGGTDINALDYTGKTPLDVAMSRLRILHSDESIRGVPKKYRDEVKQIIDMLKEYMYVAGFKEEEKELDNLCKKLDLTISIEQVSIRKNLVYMQLA
jgi:hypothetical protein